MVKTLPAVQEIQVWSQGQEDALENGMAGYSPWGHKELGTTEWLTHYIFGGGAVFNLLDCTFREVITDHIQR